MRNPTYLIPGTSTLFENPLYTKAFLNANMPKPVCRIRWRRGEPLGLIEYTSPTFLDLPREVRDQIYYTVLVSPNPISVCSMHYTWTTRSQDRRFTSIERLTLDPSCPILAPPRLAIISCSRQLAVEARAAFYSLNTFRFAGHEAWQPMYRWLDMIGEGARAHLQNLMVEVLLPKGLIQDRHGSHEFCYHYGLPWQFRRVAFSCDSGKDSREPVDYLSPAIEACFRILGKAGRALALRLVLSEDFIPGERASV